MPDNSYTIEEERRFREIFDRFKVPIHDYVKAIVGDHDMAEDIAQDIFIRIWKKRSSLHEIDNIDNYLFRVAKNACMSFFRKAALDVKVREKLKANMVPPNDSVTEQVDLREMERLLEKAIASLSPQRRKVYEMSRKEGMKIEEIATELGVSVNTVKNHLVKSLQLLKEYLMKHSRDPYAVMFWAVLMNKL